VSECGTKNSIFYDSSCVHGEKDQKTQTVQSSSSSSSFLLRKKLTLSLGKGRKTKNYYNRPNIILESKLSLLQDHNKSSEKINFFAIKTILGGKVPHLKELKE
jgi:hypothetical protein